MIAQIPLIYKDLLEDLTQDNPTPNVFYVYFGGRGAGKSENIGQGLTIASTIKRLRILCIRETQSSIAESVKSLIEKWIHALELTDQFNITNTTITNIHTGSEFLFMGMKSHTAVNVKSINNIDITWIEEAEAFSQRSWDLLVPSVTRTQNPKIIITFNPYKEDDTIYKEFIVNAPPKNSIIKKVNYDSNPFFENSYLAKLRADDEERLPQEVYRHKWLGEILTSIEQSLFKNVSFEPIPLHNMQFIKKIVAVDPATTNKDYSNEFGIVVLGKAKSGLIVVLDDYSGKYTPFEFGNQLNKACNDYNISDVVVETNQGGDFIKAIIVDVNPTLRVTEVRASSSKCDRALPVANLMEVGKVVMGRELKPIKRQLELMTTNGYLGFKGESPDRADAMIWGVYHLANIIDKDSIYTIFNHEWFNLDIDFISKANTTLPVTLYIAPHLDKYICIKLQYLTFDKVTKLYITDSFSLDTLDNLQDLAQYFIIKDIPLVETLKNNLNLNSYLPIKEKDIDKKVMNILPICKNNCVMLDTSENTYNNIHGNLLALDIMEFKLESDRQFLFLELLCDIIYTEWGLDKGYND